MAIKRAELAAKLSKITLPNNTPYDVKDYFAPHFKGLTNSNITATYSDTYTLVDTEPASFDPTAYYKKVDNNYVPGEAGDEWAADTWYTRETVETLTAKNPINLKQYGDSSYTSTTMGLGDLVLYGDDLYIAIDETDAATNNVSWLKIASMKDDNTTYTITTGSGADGTITVTPSDGSAYTVAVKGLGNAAFQDVATSYDSSDTEKPVTGAVLASAIQGITSAMVYKGGMTVTVDGTDTTKLIFTIGDEEIQTGYVYKVTSVTLDTYTGLEKIQIGDAVIAVDDITATGSAGSYSVEYDPADWTIIPSGDDIDVTSVGTNGVGITTDVTSGATTNVDITTTGNINLKLQNSNGALDTAGITPGTGKAAFAPSVGVNGSGNLATGFMTDGTYSTASGSENYIATESTVANAINNLQKNEIHAFTGTTTAVTGVGIEAASGTAPSGSIGQYWDVSGETLTFKYITTTTADTTEFDDVLSVPAVTP